MNDQQLLDDLEHLQQAFEYRCARRAEKAVQEQKRRPLYWLQPPADIYDGRVHLLVARQIPGDSEFPWSWKYQGFGPIQDPQLLAARAACTKLCISGWGDYSEETSDALWYSYQFSENQWEQIKTLMRALLGEPGECPES